MKVLLFAADKQLRDAFASALQPASRLIVAWTRREALRQVSSEYDGVVIVEQGAPGAARDVLKACVGYGVSVLWCGEASPKGTAVVHVTSPAHALASLGALLREIRVLAVGTDPTLAAELRLRRFWVDEVRAVDGAEALAGTYDWILVGDGSFETLRLARAAKIGNRAAVLAPDRKWPIDASMLGVVRIARSATVAEIALTLRRASVSGEYVMHALPDLSEEVIEGALAANGGCWSAAARALGRTAQGLRYWARKLERERAGRLVHT